jgi:trypsin
MYYSTRRPSRMIASPHHCASLIIALCGLLFDNAFAENAAVIRGTRHQRQAAVERKITTKLSSDPRIVGGTPAAPGVYPFHVSSIDKVYLCGGTLIAPDIVLTAAHCGDSFLSGVHVGGILLDGTDAVETLQVDGEYPHPDYDDVTLLNDIMLVKLSTPATLSPIVTLNFDPSIPAEGDVVTVIGFGDTTDGGELSSELLMVDLDIYLDDFCLDIDNAFAPETIICAGTVAGGRDSCQGDSGGPLLTPDNVQIGIVSYGVGCGEPDIPGIYAEVSGFASFIRAGICSK